MQNSPVQHRFFWTWDQSMDWVPLAPGIQELGCYEPYLKRPENFVADYKLLIDFSAANGFTGITIWGFLRDNHGGIDAAGEICRYGKEKGVSILPGAGINAYGGVYWEGDHPYNLTTWLNKHPELEAVRKNPSWNRRFNRMACPSRKENQQWNREAIQWLCETFEIGGINFETGDYGTCQCEACRKKSEREGLWSVRDMAEQLDPLIRLAQKTRPGLLAICECYFDNVLDVKVHAPLKTLPEDTLLQFSFNRSYWPRIQKELTPEVVADLPPQPKLLRTHMGSQWVRPERHDFVAKDFAALARKVSEVDFNGATVFGEVSASETLNEINYLALSSFCDRPDQKWETFVSESLGPKLGGAREAASFIQYLENENGLKKEDIGSIREKLCKAKGPAAPRWAWLLNRAYKRNLKNCGT